MSDLSQAVEISGGIFALMMATQYGTRHFGLHKIAMPVLAVAGFGYAYLKDAPTDHNSIVLYLVGAGIGAVFGLLAYFATAMWADRSTGKIMTRCTTAFVSVWLVAMAARIGFVWAVSDNASFRLTSDAIAPFFVIWALVMVVGRVIALSSRAARLRSEFRTSPTADLALAR
ncbi:MAG: hypothetical protein NTW76_12640 [Corynebacteriales bacterium]|nr:hypothetical protein [Mycobacteriales bacterium]